MAQQVLWEKFPGITPLGSVHPLGTPNVYTKLNLNPPNSFPRYFGLEQSGGQTGGSWQTDIALPRATLLARLKTTHTLTAGPER